MKSADDSKQHKTIPIVPEPSGSADEAMVSLYAASKKIYPRSVEGIFTYWRWIFVALTQLVFYGLPWLEWGTRQAVLFDLASRRFYIFGLVLYPQDFIYLTGLLVISALALFLFTAVAGRLWCGFACPQTVYSEIFLWIEHKIEGDRSARIRLDDADFSIEKLVKKVYKHIIWIFLSIWTGFTFVGYFTPIRELVMEFFLTQMSAWELFWVFFYAFATYGNAGFMREQVCKYMCPYARFQSAMFDNDTLIVTYDTERGEPRGARSKSADVAALNLGSCVDCTLCVQVCPTGIDIRDGLQYECIGCGACADVCDTVMDKLGYPKGLVRYSTQNAMDNKWTPSQMWQRLMRPRVQIYTMILVAVTVGLFVSISMRSPFKVDVVRDRSSLSRITEYGTLENVYRLQIMNASEVEQIYRLGVKGLPELKITTETQISVAPAQARWVVLSADIPYGSAQAGSHKIEFEVEALGIGHAVLEKSVFIVPR
ncbi:cytochrome c oxidase accessory protein CcoG [Limnohabitans sp.]|uniref:cytochrome c oxidase accessory protein CcoG n=1 Tax=Limnohabitans sp. TaxID=1907725 RepID=UPI0026BF636B|nr:cytochrome c oxidase accessory protein CcoG [Limnohabitans sp.]